MMKQFNLDIWLQDKSRKVITRRGNPVRIICTDRKHGEDDLPIVFLEEIECGEFLLTCRNDGRSDTYDTQYDLFFADEEEELTEFEKELKAMIQDVERGDYIEEESFDFWRDRLLDLARKELLKDLPKWKKATEKKEMDYYVALYEDEEKVVLSTELYKGEYYLELNDLKTLPKEE